MTSALRSLLSDGRLMPNYSRDGSGDFNQQLVTLANAEAVYGLVAWKVVQFSWLTFIRESLVSADLRSVRQLFVTFVHCLRLHRIVIPSIRINPTGLDAKASRYGSLGRAHRNRAS